MSWYDDWCCLAPGRAEEIGAEEMAYSRMHLGWTTARDTFIPYERMDTSHLLNCRRKIERDKWRTEFLPYINNELKMRGHDCKSV